MWLSQSGRVLGTSAHQHPSAALSLNVVPLSPPSLALSAAAVPLCSLIESQYKYNLRRRAAGALHPLSCRRCPDQHQYCSIYYWQDHLLDSLHNHCPPKLYPRSPKRAIRLNGCCGLTIFLINIINFTVPFWYKLLVGAVLYQDVIL